MLYLTFQENCFNFVAQNLAKNCKCSFQTHRAFVSEVKVASKPFPEKFPMTTLSFKWFWTLCLTFPKNGFNFVNQRLTKNWKMIFSNTQNNRFWAQDLFRGSFLWPGFDLISFDRFPPLCQNSTSTSSLKNLQKTQNWSFQMFRTFIFELKISSKHFSKNLPINKFSF